MKGSGRIVRYEVHALRRMQQRGISKEQVAQVLRRPQANRSARREGAKRLERRLSAKRRLAVIVEETDRFIRIVSAFWM